MTFLTHPQVRHDFIIVDETDDWIVIDKPPFLQAHPSKPGGPPTLWDGLRELLSYELVNGGQVSIINRLDRETSGLTLVAKNAPTARAFSMAMARRAFRKEYLALVDGWPAEDEWEVALPVRRKGEFAPSRVWLKQAPHASGAAARTRFLVEGRFESPKRSKRFSLVRAFPETGRMHQIRVHLAASGHPIIGDKLYGPSEDCYLEFIETGWTEALAKRLLLPRQALHASRLSLPESGLEWDAPFPADLAGWAGLTSEDLDPAAAGARPAPARAPRSRGPSGLERRQS